MKNNAKKYFILGIVIILLTLSVVVTFLGNDSEKKSGSIANLSLKESSIVTDTDNSELKSSVEIGGTNEKTDFTKTLIPYAETNATGGDLKKFSTVNEHMLYYRFLSFNKGKEINFTVGYMEGCPDGCFFNNETICPEACTIPANWQTVQTFKGTGLVQYAGVFKRDGLEDTTKFYCEIGMDPLRLTYCSHVKYFEMGEWVRHRIKLDKDTKPIILSE